MKTHVEMEKQTAGRFHPAKVERCRIEDLDEVLRGSLQAALPFPLRKGTRILLAGGEGRDPGRRAFFAYNHPAAAFVVARSPLLLGARGEILRVNEGKVLYIPSDRHALSALRIKRLAAAAALLLALAAASWILLARNGSQGVPLPAYGDTAAILDGGYKTLADLPEEYVSSVPPELREVFYASADEGDPGDRARVEDEVVDKVLDYIDSGRGRAAIHDRRLISFYDRLIRSGNHSPRIRLKAFRLLCKSAAFFYLPVKAVERFLECDVPEIREEARMVIAGGRWHPLILPGNPR